MEIVVIRVGQHEGDGPASGMIEAVWMLRCGTHTTLCVLRMIGPTRGVIDIVCIVVDGFIRCIISDIVRGRNDTEFLKSDAVPDSVQRFTINVINERDVWIIGISFA